MTNVFTFPDEYFRCDWCNSLWQWVDLWYSEGDCPNEDCDAIDEQMIPITQEEWAKEKWDD